MADGGGGGGRRRAPRDAGPELPAATERLPALSAPTGSPAQAEIAVSGVPTCPQAARLQLGNEPASSPRV